MTGEFSEKQVEGKFALQKWGVSSGMKVSDFFSSIHRNSECVNQTCILLALNLKSQVWNVWKSTKLGHLVWDYEFFSCFLIIKNVIDLCMWCLLHCLNRRTLMLIPFIVNEEKVLWLQLLKCDRNVNYKKHSIFVPETKNNFSTVYFFSAAPYDLLPYDVQIWGSSLL